MARQSKGALTPVNIHACFTGLRDGGGLVGPRVEAVSLPHYRRCMANQLLVPGDTPGVFKLGEAFQAQYEAFVQQREAHDIAVRKTSPGSFWP